MTAPNAAVSLVARGLAQPAQPYMRLMRLHHFDGMKPQEAVVHVLRIVGLRDSAASAMFKNLVKTLSLCPQRLSVVGGGYAGPPSSADEWFKDRGDPDLSPEEYSLKYGLGRYDLRVPHGRARVKSALRLWDDPATRALLSGLMVANPGADDRRIRARLEEVSPTGAAPSEDEIRSFRELLWDFDGCGAANVRAFILSLTDSEAPETSLVYGEAALLHQLGIEPKDLSREAMWRSIRTSAFIQLDQVRRRPDAFNSKAFKATVEVFAMADEAIRQWEAEDDSALIEEIATLKLKEQQEPQHVDELLLEVDLQIERDLVQSALDVGAISEEEAGPLLGALDKGSLLPGEMREALTAGIKSVSMKISKATPKKKGVDVGSLIPPEMRKK